MRQCNLLATLLLRLRSGSLRRSHYSPTKVDMRMGITPILLHQILIAGDFLAETESLEVY